MPERPVHHAAVQAPAAAPEGRDWAREQRWVEQIVDHKLAQFAEGVGEALARDRAAFKREVEALRGEMRAAAPSGEALMATLKNIESLLERSIERLGVTDARLARLDGGDLRLPH